MKTIIAILALSSQVSFSQTNFYPVLECSNRTYTNVTIDSVTAATVTVFWDGGGEKISITNLPLSVQKQFHYDPSAARAYLDGIAAKKAARQMAAYKSAAAADRAKSTLGPSHPIRIIKTISAGIVQVLDNGVYANAYIHNLPLEVSSFVDDFNSTKANLDSLANVTGLETVVLRNRARASSDAAQDAVATRQHWADIWPHRFDRSTIIASPTSFFISTGVRQWEFQAIPAPEIQ